MKNKKWLKWTIIILLCLGLLGTITLIGINCHVKSVADSRIITAEQCMQLEDIDCIIVLGCQVKEDGTLSHMLRDRLSRGVELYQMGAAPKLLMSGDHGRKAYNEVGAMKQYAIDNGVPSEDVFMDHAGFSTYETVYRAKEVFQARRVIIVTQQYHLYRALYIADSLGLEAYGVSADHRTYAGQTMRDIREVFARVKDFAMCIFEPKPTYLGEEIPITGNGDLTND